MINYIKYISTRAAPLTRNRLIGSKIRGVGMFSEEKDVPVSIQEHKFFKMVKDLQNQQYVKGLIREEIKLKELPQGKYATFKHLKAKINDLLHLWRLITWAQAYHSSLQVSSLQQAIKKIQHLSDLAFSERVNRTHQNLDEQKMQGYTGVNFSLYFELALRIMPEMSEFYLNAYLHMVRQHWPLELLRVRQALRDQQITVLEKMIIEKSTHYIGDLTRNMIMMTKQQKSLNEIQMALYLSYYKNILQELESWQIDEIKERIWSYLMQDDNQNSFIHLENILLCLFLAVNNLEMTEAVNHWLSFKLKDKHPNPSLIYLSNLYSHQDKPSCLKVDLWMAILRHNLTKPENQRNNQLQTIALRIVEQLRSINFITWKFKYQAWMLDTVVTSLQSNEQIIQRLVAAVCKQKIAGHHVLSSFVSCFISYTTQKDMNPHRLFLEQTVSSWLCSQSNPSLLSQPAQILCEILPHADLHPALHSLYFPYLYRLLQLSLGQFQWPVLNQLYYFGLRWKCHSTDEVYWRMQYVRRYIMNQYAEMGIRRRQIPEDSYFYRIHEQTTPQQFYRNFLERQ